MRRSRRFVALLAAALAVVPFLPLYVERTFMYLFLPVGVRGATSEWGWRLRTLAGFWKDYAHFRPEQRPALWLCVNVALAVVYALLLALAADRLLALLVRVSRFKSGSR
jgi:hypothetical protein